MSTLLALPIADTPQISESQIRTHLEAINRKLEVQNLEPIPINISDWLVEDGVVQMHADSIRSYISELSDEIEGENRQRENKRKKAQEELTAKGEKLRKLKQEYDTGWYKKNHDEMNVIQHDLQKRWKKSPKRPQLLDQLVPLKEIDAKWNLIQKSITDCDAELAQIKVRLGKIPQDIPETFIQETEKNLGEIHIKQIKVVHIDEPKEQKERQKKTRQGISPKAIAAAAAIALCGIMMNKDNDKDNWNIEGDMPVNNITEKWVLQKTLLIKNLADQICWAFENFIKNPNNLDKTSCNRYLTEMIASCGWKIQGEGLVLKDVKFTRTLLEVNNDKLEFSINCSYVIEDVHGNKFPEDAKIKIHLHGRFPWPERIETNLIQDTKLKDIFEMTFLWQCQKRFPPNNIFGLNIWSVKVLEQINHPEKHTSHIKIEFGTNKWPIVLEKDSKIKE